MKLWEGENVNIYMGQLFQRRGKRRRRRFERFVSDDGAASGDAAGAGRQKDRWDCWALIASSCVHTRYEGKQHNCTVGSINNWRRFGANVVCGALFPFTCCTVSAADLSGTKTEAAEKAARKATGNTRGRPPRQDRGVCESTPGSTSVWSRGRVGGAIGGARERAPAAPPPHLERRPRRLRRELAQAQVRHGS